MNEHGIDFKLLYYFGWQEHKFYLIQRQSFTALQTAAVVYTLLKKTIEPCPKHNRKLNGFNGYNGNCVLVSMETIMVSTLPVCDGLYWWDVKSYWKNAQNTQQQKMNFVMVLLEKGL